MRPDYVEHLLRDAGRVELRHDSGTGVWQSGVFTDGTLLRDEIRRRAGVGNLYTSVNAPRLMPVTNAMGGRALGDDDIAFHTRLLFDFDPARPRGVPSTDAELHDATTARDRFVASLLGLGWPMPATAVSGNGAHAVYRCRMPATTETAEALTTVYVGMKQDFSTDAVKFDTTVRNPSRIWRLYGSLNRKGTPTDGRPHRLATVTLPHRWNAVSLRQVMALASAYARRRKPVEQATGRTYGPAPKGHGDYSTLDVAAWFRAHGSYRRPLGDGKHAVACPWDHEHSTVDPDHSTATVVWDAHERVWPNFKCQHDHCQGRGIRDVLALWADADHYCARRWEKRA